MLVNYKILSMSLNLNVVNTSPSPPRGLIRELIYYIFSGEFEEKLFIKMLKIDIFKPQNETVHR